MRSIEDAVRNGIINAIQFFVENGEWPPRWQEAINNQLFDVSTTESFGLMSVNFSLPVSFTIKNLSIMLSYSYSIPIALPGEEFELDPIGYFGTTLSYRIPFK